MNTLSSMSSFSLNTKNIPPLPPPVWTNLGNTSQIPTAGVFVLNSSNVYICGGSTNKTRRILKYDGFIGTISPYNIGETGQYVYTIGAFSASHVIYGGNFRNIYFSGVSSDYYTVYGIGKFNGTTNVFIGTLSTNSRGEPFVKYIFVLNSTYAYIVGKFDNISGLTGCNDIALYNSTTSTFSKLGTPPAITSFGPSTIYAVSVNEVYLLGQLAVYKYDGTSWTTLFPLTFYALWIHGIGSDLYFCGPFLKTDFTPNISSNYVVKWNSSSGFVGLGTGPTLHSQGCNKIYAYSADYVIVSGVNTGGPISRWDGTSWTRLGTGGSNSVSDFHTIGTRTLFAAGSDTLGYPALYRYG
jgi:hypothetical protein